MGNAARRDPEALARELLAAAATSTNPEPLLEAAQELLRQARAERGVIDVREARKASGGA